MLQDRTAIARPFRNDHPKKITSIGYRDENSADDRLADHAARLAGIRKCCRLQHNKESKDDLSQGYASVPQLVVAFDMLSTPSAPRLVLRLYLAEGQQALIAVSVLRNQ
jgi:hypothetical protein